MDWKVLGPLASLVAMAGPYGCSAEMQSGHGPKAAWIVVKEEQGGCLTSQAMKSEVTREVARLDGKFAHVLSPNGSEDATTRSEVWLAFDAGKLGIDGGYLILALWPESRSAETKGELRVESAGAELSAKGAKVTVNASGGGTLKGRWLYSSNPREIDAKFTCPANDIFEPYELKLFLAQPYKEASETAKLGSAGGSAFALDAIQVGELKAIALAEQALGKLMAKFGSAEYPLEWRREELTGEAISKVIGESFEVVLIPDSGEPTVIGPGNLDAHVKQHLVLRDSGGKLVGAVLKLRAKG